MSVANYALPTPPCSPVKRRLNEVDNGDNNLPSASVAILSGNSNLSAAQSKTGRSYVPCQLKMCEKKDTKVGEKQFGRANQQCIQKACRECCRLHLLNRLKMEGLRTLSCAPHKFKELTLATAKEPTQDGPSHIASKNIDRSGLGRNIGPYLWEHLSSNGFQFEEELFNYTEESLAEQKARTICVVIYDSAGHPQTAERYLLVPKHLGCHFDPFIDDRTRKDLGLKKRGDAFSFWNGTNWADINRPLEVELGGRAQSAIFASSGDRKLSLEVQEQPNKRTKLHHIFNADTADTSSSDTIDSAKALPVLVQCIYTEENKLNHNLPPFDSRPTFPFQYVVDMDNFLETYETTRQDDTIKVREAWNSTVKQHFVPKERCPPYVKTTVNNHLNYRRVCREEVQRLKAMGRVSEARWSFIAALGLQRMKNALFVNGSKMNVRAEAALNRTRTLAFERSAHALLCYVRDRGENPDWRERTPALNRMRTLAFECSAHALLCYPAYTMVLKELAPSELTRLQEEDFKVGKTPNNHSDLLTAAGLTFEPPPPPPPKRGKKNGARTLVLMSQTRQYFHTLYNSATGQRAPSVDWTAIANEVAKGPTATLDAMNTAIYDLVMAGKLTIPLDIQQKVARKIAASAASAHEPTKPVVRTDASAEDTDASAEDRAAEDMMVDPPAVENEDSTVSDSTTSKDRAAEDITDSTTSKEQLAEDITADPPAVEDSTTSKEQLAEDMMVDPPAVEDSTTSKEQLAEDITADPPAVEDSTTSKEQLAEDMMVDPPAVEDSTTSKEQLAEDITADPPAVEDSTTSKEQLAEDMMVDPPAVENEDSTVSTVSSSGSPERSMSLPPSSFHADASPAPGTDSCLDPALIGVEAPPGPSTAFRLEDSRSEDEKLYIWLPPQEATTERDLIKITVICRDERELVQEMKVPHLWYIIAPPSAVAQGYEQQLGINTFALLKAIEQVVNQTLQTFEQSLPFTAAWRDGPLYQPITLPLATFQAVSAMQDKHDGVAPFGADALYESRCVIDNASILTWEHVGLPINWVRLNTVYDTKYVFYTIMLILTEAQLPMAPPPPLSLEGPVVRKPRVLSLKSVANRKEKKDAKLMASAWYADHIKRDPAVQKAIKNYKAWSQRSDFSQGLEIAEWLTLAPAVYRVGRLTKLKYGDWSAEEKEQIKDFENLDLDEGAKREIFGARETWWRYAKHLGHLLSFYGDQDEMAFSQSVDKIVADTKGKMAAAKAFALIRGTCAPNAAFEVPKPLAPPKTPTAPS
ncbi:hypothetical protein BDZ89DRAFT_1050704 [Hymenopellis radicata]|nr:hypothetical protein BDZ89DRAFT_1050704 [Hymenopellis radicata]